MLPVSRRGLEGGRSGNEILFWGVEAALRGRPESEQKTGWLLVSVCSSRVKGGFLLLAAGS